LIIFHKRLSKQRPFVFHSPTIEHGGVNTQVVQDHYSTAVKATIYQVLNSASAGYYAPSNHRFIIKTR